MSKDYYKILGIDKNASEDDIKKAFKKGAIKWHPDRWSNKSEKEKENAEKNFKEINEANEVLSDPEKRKLYDQFGADWENVANQGGGFDGFGDLGSFFRHMHSGMDSFFGGRQQPQGPRPGQDVQVRYGISIEEIYNGCNKQIEVTVKGRCEECHGTGGDKEICSHCHGTGMITNVQRTAFGIIQNSSPCPYCHGLGSITKNKCHKCHGEGMVNLTRKIKLNIKPFTANGTNLKLTGMGYESKDDHGLNGDLYVNIYYDIDPNKYAINGNTVYEKIKIPYYDCILGTTKKVRLPNNTEEEITVKQYSSEGDQIILPGKGINGGKYIFVVSVDMPKRQLLKGISDKEKKLLKEIKKMHDS